MTWKPHWDTIAVMTIVLIISLVSATVASGVWKPSAHSRVIPTEQEVPTSKLQEIAEQLEEVKAFRERYVSPDVFSVRVYGLDLNYQVLQCEVMAKLCVKVGEIQPYARLEVWFNNDLNVDKIVLWCADGKGNAHFDRITGDIVDHLKTKVCV